jgi:hypothetical protein
MSEIDGNEAEPPALYSEPLLPIEKKLIAWSLGIGVTLLIVLAIVNHLLPVGS